MSDVSNNGSNMSNVSKVGKGIIMSNISNTSKESGKCD